MRQRGQAHLGDDHAAIQPQARRQFMIDGSRDREEMRRQSFVQSQNVVEFVDDGDRRALVQLREEEFRGGEVCERRGGGRVCSHTGTRLLFRSASARRLLFGVAGDVGVDSSSAKKANRPQ
jgi:hypothetical protein